MYLELRRRRWYALHDIPAAAQPAIGKRRFVQSLETEVRSVATRRAAVLEVRWRGEIEKARNGTSDPLERDASFFREALKVANEDERDLVLEVLRLEADKIADGVQDGRVYVRGDLDERDPDHEARAGRFYAFATGAMVRMDEHLEEYLATLNNEAKSVDMKRTTLKRFAEAFPYTSDVKRKEVQQWVRKLGEDGKAPATIQRALGELRGYWSYLISIDVASENNLPFEKLSIPKPVKGSNGDKRAALAPEEVVKLLAAADGKGDRALADLICLAMWTGARIEELCALKTANVRDGFIIIDDAKTDAGCREVPVHANLERTMERLLEGSTDGFVLSGLTLNKYGDRSNAIGKRFGRLKADEGFGPKHVFHSVRKTVATLLENAKVPEGVAADIIGHEKPTMTYGLYSGGATRETKKRALAKLRYPSFDKLPVYGVA